MEIKNGRIFINDNIIEDKNVTKNYYYNRGDYGDLDQQIKIPEGNLFALGDNSANSRDSRYWGFVPRNYMIGKAILIYWPPYRMRLIE